MAKNKKRRSKRALIRYPMDYDPRRPRAQPNPYQVSRAGGVRSCIYVGCAYGDSTEFLIRETYDQLDAVERAAPGNWTGTRRFEELRQNLRSAALDAFDDMVARDYPDPADKTIANYEELKRQIVTKLSDHTNPGDRIFWELQGKIKFEDCKTKHGLQEKPTIILQRMQRMRKMGGQLHHSQGAVFMTDGLFKQTYWNIFPEYMQTWLTEDQNLDPFDAANPMDVDELGDNM